MSKKEHELLKKIEELKEKLHNCEDELFECEHDWERETCKLKALILEYIYEKKVKPVMESDCYIVVRRLDLLNALEAGYYDTSTFDEALEELWQADILRMEDENDFIYAPKYCEGHNFYYYNTYELHVGTVVERLGRDKYGVIVMETEDEFVVYWPFDKEEERVKKEEAQEVLRVRQSSAVVKECEEK